MISKNLKSSILKIAKEFREKKEEGHYNTYLDAYKAAVTSSKIDGLSVKKLERAYYQSKRKDKITKNQNSKSMELLKTHFYPPGVLHRNSTLCHISRERCYYNLEKLVVRTYLYPKIIQRILFARVSTL